MTMLIIPYGRFAIYTSKDSYDIDRALETFEAPEEISYTLQYLVMGEWISCFYIATHWNIVRIYVIQALKICTGPVMVSLIGGVVADLQEPEEDADDLCRDCNYYLCIHGQCACLGSGQCDCWLNGMFVA